MQVSKAYSVKLESPKQDCRSARGIPFTKLSSFAWQFCYCSCVLLFTCSHLVKPDIRSKFARELRNCENYASKVSSGLLSPTIESKTTKLQPILALGRKAGKTALHYDKDDNDNNEKENYMCVYVYTHTRRQEDEETTMTGVMTTATTL